MPIAFGIRLCTRYARSRFELPPWLLCARPNDNSHVIINCISTSTRNAARHSTQFIHLKFVAGLKFYCVKRDPLNYDHPFDVHVVVYGDCDVGSLNWPEHVFHIINQTSFAVSHCRFAAKKG